MAKRGSLLSEITRNVAKSVSAKEAGLFYGKGKIEKLSKEHKKRKVEYCTEMKATIEIRCFSWMKKDFVLGRSGDAAAIETPRLNFACCGSSVDPLRHQR